MMNYRLVFAKLTWFLFLESYSGVGMAYNAGKLVLLTTTAFAAAGLKIAFDTIYMGGRIVFITITTAATFGKNIVYATLKGLAYSVYFITNRGMRILHAPFHIVGRLFTHACEVPDYFGHNKMSCDNR